MKIKKPNGVQFGELEYGTVFLDCSTHTFYMKVADSYNTNAVSLRTGFSFYIKDGTEVIPYYDAELVL